MLVLLKKLGGLFHGKHALLTNTVSGAILFIIGDAIEQAIEVKSKVIPEFDSGRLGRIGLIGIFEGPPHYFFYKYLDKFLPDTSVKTVGKKVLADQLIGCPMFGIQFFMGMSLLEGKPVPEAWAEFKRKFPTVYMFDWMCWPPCQFINFYLVPGKYRVLYVNFVTVCWNVFLSYMKHYDQHEVKNGK